MLQAMRNGFLCLVMLTFIFHQDARSESITFLGEPMELGALQPFRLAKPDVITADYIRAFRDSMDQNGLDALAQKLLTYKQDKSLDDWLYYQLLRKTAFAICPKFEHYGLYTLYKWYLLGHSGYETAISLSENNLLFYVRTDDQVYGIPFFEREGKRFICLNRHDFPEEANGFGEVMDAGVFIAGATKPFSYKIQQIPAMQDVALESKHLGFEYKNKKYEFEVKLNSEVRTLFRNYPVADFETYFNIPLSHETYSSLIPALRNSMRNMKTMEGIDFLMHFTRYSFLYEEDQKYFGQEKRLSPEQTLLYEQSDCDDRAALFFYLVKEIYNLPMIVLLYPTHVTIAVELNQEGHRTIEYQGRKYSVCEPTPQAEELGVGKIPKHLRRQSYDIVYAYQPVSR